MARRFWTPDVHGTELTARLLTDAGWSRTAGDNCELTWSLDLPDQATFRLAADGPWINHVPGSESLTAKHHLCATLRAWHQRAAAAGVTAPHPSPETFVLPAEWNEWMRMRSWDPDLVWIQKPAEMSRGRGVALVVDPDEVRGSNLVVQRYLTNPHLIDGYKYTLRCYVLVVSIDPLIAYLFDNGFTKLASRPFSLAPEHRADRYRHLTNPDILRDDPGAAGVSTRNFTHVEYRQRLQDAGTDPEQIWRGLRRILATAVIAAQPYMRASARAAGVSGRGQFELMGIDVAVDERLRPWLIECNQSPSLSVEASPATKASLEEADIKTRVIRDTLSLIGADTESAAPLVPLTGSEARARLAWHERRRGAFERLWPSREALEVLAGVDELSPLDLDLLAQEAAVNWPATAVNAVDTMTCAGTLLYERVHDRLSLLDDGEAHAWRTLSAGRAAEETTAAHGVTWLREGLLAPPDRAGLSPEHTDPPIGERLRIRWNREQVFAVNGLRVGLTGATAQHQAAIDTAFAWWAADDEDIVDVSIPVSGRAGLPELAAQLQRLALARVGGVLRRRSTVASRAGAYGLVVGKVSDPELAKEGWSLTARHVVFGGSPFGAWIDNGGRLELLSPVTLIAPSTSRADVLLDLAADGPGVIRVRDSAAIGRLAEWIATVSLITASGQS